MSRIDIIAPALLPFVHHSLEWSNLVKLSSTEQAAAQTWPLNLYSLGKQPIAAIIAKAHRLSAQSHYLIASPIHLTADQHSAYASTIPVEALNLATMQQLAAELNRLFKTESLTFHPLSEDLLLLESQQALAINTLPSYCLFQQNIAHYLPTGANKSYWHKLFTEIQMYLYQHPINLSREQQALSSIDALWFWGEGEIPLQTSLSWAQIYSDNTWLKPFAHYYDSQFYPLIFKPDLATLDIELETHSLVFVEGLSQSLALSQKQSLAKHLVEFMQRAYQAKVELRLYPSLETCYYLNSSTSSLWQRIKQLLIHD